MRLQLLASLGGWDLDWDDWFDFDWLNEAGVARPTSAVVLNGGLVTALIHT